MYIEQELIEKYNENKSRGLQKYLLAVLKKKKLPMPQPHISTALQGRYPVNKKRHAIIKAFIEGL